MIIRLDLVIIALLAAILFVHVTAGANAMSAAIASEIGDLIRATPDADGFHIAYEILNERLTPHLRWLQTLSAAIFACAVIFFIAHFSPTSADQDEKPATGGPASRTND